MWTRRSRAEQPPAVPQSSAVSGSCAWRLGGRTGREGSMGWCRGAMKGASWLGAGAGLGTGGGKSAASVKQ